MRIGLPEDLLKINFLGRPIFIQFVPVLVPLEALGVGSREAALVALEGLRVP